MDRPPRLVVLPPQHLGHELHVGRCIVIDMLINHALSKNYGDAVITGLPDRRFFYEALLGQNQVFDFSIIPTLQHPIRPPKVAEDYIMPSSSVFKTLPEFANFDIINLSAYALPDTYCTFGTSDDMHRVGYSVPERYWSDEFVNLAQRFNFCNRPKIPALFASELPAFIVIHHRHEASFDDLFRLLAALPLELPKVLFGSNIKELKSQFRGLPHVIFTDDLRLYATLLSDRRCKLLISEWSGAGQLAQYTLGTQGKVWFYYNHYADIYNYNVTHKLWEHNAKLGSYFNCWDFKKVSGCEVQHFASFEAVLEAARQIRLPHRHPLRPRHQP